MFYFNFILNVGTLSAIGYCVGLHFHLFAEINRVFSQVVSMFPF
jgi:hypothetical protein